MAAREVMCPIEAGRHHIHYSWLIYYKAYGSKLSIHRHASE